METLQIWNIVMAFLQFAMGILLVVVYSDKNLFDRPIELSGTSVEKVPSSSSAEYELSWGEKNRGKANIAAEAVAFFFITGIFHSIYAITNCGCYDKMIRNQNNSLRWIEYSITATLMIRIIALQAGVRDEDTLSLITVNTVGVMLQGQIVESTLANNKLDDKQKMTIFIASIIGWILMISNFYIIVNTFINLDKDIDKFNCKDVSIPDFVVWIIITQLIFYASFGFIQLVQIFNKLYRPSNYNYRTYELAYIVDSLASKLTLGSILAYAVLGADEGAYGTFTC